MSTTKGKALPVRFDPRVMADQNQELIGDLPIKDMQRLENLLVKAEPMVMLNLQFSYGQYGLPVIVGQIRLILSLRCERCLDEFQTTIDEAIHTMIKPKAVSIPENSENLDFYEYDGKNLELTEFIEDELILALPLVPRHKDISLCNQDMIAWLASNEVPADKAENPFAILKR